MYRTPKLGLFLLSLAILTLASCALKTSTATTQAATAGPGEIALTLLLPESQEAPDHAPDRVTTLKIDGKDFSEPKGKPLSTKRVINIKPAADQKNLTIVYSFWKVTYVNTIRTRVVPIDNQKAIEVDFNKEDPKQPDKIIPIYYPTPAAVVDAMCELGKVGKEDVVYDIGCGDGRMVIGAVKRFNAKKGIGIDIREEMVTLSKDNAKKEGVSDKVSFRAEDALKMKELPEATVVLLYLGDDLNVAIRPLLQKSLKPGSRVVSHRFLMGDWKPDETKKIVAKNNDGTDEDYDLHLWTIK